MIMMMLMIMMMMMVIMTTTTTMMMMTTTTMIMMIVVTVVVMVMYGDAVADGGSGEGKQAMGTDVGSFSMPASVLAGASDCPNMNTMVRNHCLVKACNVSAFTHRHRKMFYVCGLYRLRMIPLD